MTKLEKTIFLTGNTKEQIVSQANILREKFVKKFSIVAKTFGIQFFGWIKIF